MKRLLVVPILLMTFIVSCQNEKQYRRKVYLGYELGSSINEYNLHTKELIKSRLLRQTKLNTLYSETSSLNYSYFLFTRAYFPLNDTLISELQVMYLDHLEDLEEDVNLFSQQYAPMNLQFGIQSRASSHLIRDSEISKLNKKYGTYNHRDTIQDNSFRQVETITWSNRDGVDIKIEYKKDMISKFPLSSIVLKYKFTPEFYKKIFNSSSNY